jgi:hypothetical protein
VDAAFCTNETAFYRDPNNDTRINDRDRFFVRGQLRFEPTDALNIRLIGDYTTRDEACCAAVYVDRTVNPFIGNLNEPVPSVNAGPATFGNGNNIINVLRDLGQDITRFNSGYRRIVSVTPGRSYDNKTEDWGVSGQIDYDFGGVQLTSITAYRDYLNANGSDTDYSTVDILYNAPNGNNSRNFRTFTQEIRLNGELFDGRVDWLIGGFFADEKFRGRSNLRFGSQYGRFATCRLISGGGLAPFYSPTSAGCLSPTGRAVLSGLVPTVPSPFGPAGPGIVAAIDRLDSINDRGSTVDLYRQNSTSFAAFTHNIFSITDTVDLTLGLRYTKERKEFSATFGNDNTACVANQQGAHPIPRECRPRAGGGRHHRLVVPRQLDRRAEWRQHCRRAQGGRVHRHSHPVVEADRGSVALRQLLARLQGRRFQFRPLGAEGSDPVFCFLWRRQQCGWRSSARGQPPVRSGNR